MPKFDLKTAFTHFLSDDSLKNYKEKLRQSDPETKLIPKEVLMVVHKRDGNTEDFDASKLLRAIKKANAKSPEKEEEAKLEKVATSATSFIKSLKKDVLIFINSSFITLNIEL